MYFIISSVNSIWYDIYLHCKERKPADNKSHNNNSHCSGCLLLSRSTGFLAPLLWSFLSTSLKHWTYDYDFDLNRYGLNISLCSKDSFESVYLEKYFVFCPIRHWCYTKFESYTFSIKLHLRKWYMWIWVVLVKFNSIVARCTQYSPIIFTFSPPLNYWVYFDVPEF